MPSRGGGVLGRIADWFIPGNAYNSTRGTWNPATTKVGIAGLIADQFVPGGSNLVGMAANSGLLGDGISSGLQRENTYNAISDQFGDTRAGLADYLHSQRPEIGGYNPQVSVGQPQYASVGSFAPSVPTMPAVQAQGPWQGLGTQTGDVFGGGSLGSWASGGGQQAPMNAAMSAGGGASMGGGIGHGWTGVSGAAAQSMFGGMRGGSDDEAQMEALMSMRRQQQ